MLGFGILLFGLAHYLIFRTTLPLYGAQISGMHALAHELPTWYRDGLPSFAFVAGLILLDAAARPRQTLKHKLILTGQWLVVAWSFELAQAYQGIPFLSGTFDVIDLGASFLGGLCSFALLHLRGRSARLVALPFSASWLLRGTRIALVPLAIVMITATSERVPSERAWPTYTKERIKWSGPRPISKVGRISLYKNFLLVNESGEGIHIIDNTDRKNPSPLGFITIPEHSDVAVKDGILYANVGRDLIIIDASRLPEIEVLNFYSDFFGYHDSYSERDTAVNYGDPNNYYMPSALPPRKATCLFANELDGCVLLTDVNGKNRLFGCRANEQTSLAPTGEKAATTSCSIDLPEGTRLSEYVSICSATVVPVSDYGPAEFVLDFSADPCTDPEHFNENANLLRKEYEHYKTIYTLHNSPESIQALEELVAPRSVNNKATEEKK